MREPSKVYRGLGSLPAGMPFAIRFYAHVIDGGDCGTIDPDQRGFFTESLTT